MHYHQEMCVGFMLAGIGQEAQRGTPANFMVVDKGSQKKTFMITFVVNSCRSFIDTDETDISNCLTGLMNRNDIAIVLVSVDVANRIRPVMNKFKNSLIPNLLEIPSKDHPYNVEDDEILKMAAVIQIALCVSICL